MYQYAMKISQKYKIHYSTLHLIELMRRILKMWYNGCHTTIFAMLQIIILLLFNHGHYFQLYIILSIYFSHQFSQIQCRIMYFVFFWYFHCILMHIYIQGTVWGTLLGTRYSYLQNLHWKYASQQYELNKIEIIVLGTYVIIFATEHLYYCLPRFKEVSFLIHNDNKKIESWFDHISHHTTN